MILQRVGCELECKPLLAADTNHGSRISIGNCSGEQCFDQCWPASDQVLSLRVLGDHCPGCNIRQTEAISSVDLEHPESYLIEKLPADRAGQPFDERMRDPYIGQGLHFRHPEYSNARPTPMNSLSASMR